MSRMYKRICPVCGTEFETPKVHGVYCRPACKEKAYRERQKRKIRRTDGGLHQSRAVSAAKPAKLKVVDWRPEPFVEARPIIGTPKTRRFQELVCLGVYDDLPA